MSRALKTWKGGRRRRRLDVVDVAIDLERQRRPCPLITTSPLPLLPAIASPPPRACKWVAAAAEREVEVKEAEREAGPFSSGEEGEWRGEHL